MNAEQARRIIKNTLEQPFDKTRFTNFVRNLLNSLDEATFTYQGNIIPEAFKEYIQKMERIGKYHDGKHSLDVLVVTLKRKQSLERARTRQRNLIAWYLNGSRGKQLKDAALVAFVAPDQADWRFSLVKMDYELEESASGKLKAKEKFTPAKRWSFLVGANEKSHTAQSRLVDLLAEETRNPTLDDLETAFDIEPVTKEFFHKYRDLFLRTKEALDQVEKQDAKVRADFAAKGVDTVNFAKKLLGQIVFLYFLQKKGWFGVQRGDNWGNGSKHFLRNLFDKQHSDDKNFFNDILEPLFYEALRNDRSHEDHYYSRFDCKIPFLNGGLFDPIGNYDWVSYDIHLPNTLFSNTRRTCEGDVGDGILDIFDRYNFTVREDEPLEKEVAIDPELLGKTYEKFNAIRPDNFDEFTRAMKSARRGEESKFNKKFGVYYTPPEIVHYMCQQSLIQYLHTQAEEAGLHDRITRQDLEDLIVVGELIRENEVTARSKADKIKKGEQQSTEYTVLLADSIAEHATAIDRWLKEITVCDPAVGSGAFPVGMMTEIVRARNVLSVFVEDGACNDYNFKRRCIEQSLYGVDIDPGAVEIAKLRLWLSLIVDETDIQHIKPLPNLDYRIMQGNSLISEFMGIDLDAEETETQELFLGDTDDIITQFQHKKAAFLNAAQVKRKKELRAEVEDLLIEIFEAKLSSQKADYFRRREEIKREAMRLPDAAQRETYQKQQMAKLNRATDFDLDAAEAQLKEFTSGKKIKAFFPWRLYFSEVFHLKGGFDVVIANPPYLRIQEIQKNDTEFAKQLKEKFISAIGSFDIYACFVEQAIKLVRKNGNIAYILPHKFFQAAFGKNIRKIIASTKMLRKIVDFGSSQVFDTATTYTCLLFLSHGNKKFSFAELKEDTTVKDLTSIFNFIDNDKQGENQNLALAHISNNDLDEKEWHFTAGKSGRILTKLRQQPRRLADICEKMFQGIATSADKIYFLQHLSDNGETVSAYSKSLDKEIEIEKAFVKPLLKGADVHRYATLTPKIWCIFPYGIVNDKASLFAANEIARHYPLAWDYLLRNKNDLENRENGRMAHDKFYAYIYPKNLTEFYNTKIVTPDIAKKCQMTLDTESLYHTTTVYSLIFKKNTESQKYYLSLLNSSLLWFFLTSTGSVLRGGFFRFKTNYLMPFPIPPQLNTTAQKPFIELVDKILALTRDADYLDNSDKQAQVQAYEREIDQMVYALYGLTEAEIRLVEEGAP